jgi:hypothetical protein
MAQKLRDATQSFYGARAPCGHSQPHATVALIRDQVSASLFSCRLQPVTAAACRLSHLYRKQAPCSSPGPLGVQANCSRLGTRMVCAG